jgi:hypothetical protein
MNASPAGFTDAATTWEGPGSSRIPAAVYVVDDDVAKAATSYRANMKLHDTDHLSSLSDSHGPNSP